MNMYIVIVFNLKLKGCLAYTFGGDIPSVPGAIVKDTFITCLIVYM